MNFKLRNLVILQISHEMVVVFTHLNVTLSSPSVIRTTPGLLGDDFKTTQGHELVKKRCKPH